MKRMMTAVLATVLFVPVLTLNVGCSDAQMAAFKTAAASGFGDGLKTIMSAVIDGAIAAATPSSSSK